MNLFSSHELEQALPNTSRFFQLVFYSIWFKQLLTTGPTLVFDLYNAFCGSSVVGSLPIFCRVIEKLSSILMLSPSCVSRRRWSFWASFSSCHKWNQFSAFWCSFLWWPFSLCCFYLWCWVSALCWFWRLLLSAICNFWRCYFVAYCTYKSTSLLCSSFLLVLRLARFLSALCNSRFFVLCLLHPSYLSLFPKPLLTFPIFCMPPWQSFLLTI